MKRTISVILCAVLLISLAPSVSYADRTVYTTKTGKKYHSKQDCVGLNLARAVYTDTESHAISIGLERCDICWDDTSPTPDSKTDETPVIEDATPTAQTLTIGDYGRLLKKKAHTKKVKLLTAKNDPNKLLGKDGQYTGKLFWWDDRIGGEESGTIEIFANKLDATKRYRNLKKAGKEVDQSMFLYDTSLLRVSRDLKKSRRVAYRNAVNKLNGEKPRFTRW